MAGGLATVVTLPCRDEHTHVVGDSALLVTEATREEPARYRAALEAFAGR